MIIKHAAAPDAGTLAVRPDRAAELLDTSRRTIYLLMATGELRWFYIGSARRRITIADIEAYIERQQAAAS
jgi:excisionase family DNA binding protein